ncbi:MAG: carboxy terminal-processing peptidase [Steroidobacteraceae bacterium]
MQNSYRHPLSWFALAALAVLVMAGPGSSGAPAGASLLPPGALAPSERQRLVARRIGAILEEAHYRKATIDDRLSEQVFNRYVDSLDGQHSYFLASDVAEFGTFRLRFDDMIHTGDIEPAYLIFARFQQRNRERVRQALELLKLEPDWTLNEGFEFDREKAAWPATTQELDEIWRKRVKSDALSLQLTGKNWKDSVDVLQKRYERVLKRVDQVTADDVFENLMNAYARTFDPHSSYFGARNSEEYRIQMSLSYDGIGASLQLTDDYVTVINVIAGGPAAASGALNTNDRIIAIGQGKEGSLQEVIGWRLDDVVQLIRGKGGTAVRLQILPAGAAPGSTEKVVDFVRGKVTLENQAAKKDRKLVTRNGKELRIGVVSVPGFYQDVQAQNQGDQNFRSTTRDVRRLLGELVKEGGMDGLVLDLRGDGGGYLPEATALTGLFIDKGPVVQLKDTSGRLEVLNDPENGTSYDGPLVVLVDRFSASASEIFAGAIQDYRRGVIVGQRTFGKGTVQNLIPLDRWSQRPVDGQLTVTIGKFYRVTGESTQHRGVEPDIALPSDINIEEIGESALDSALPWDRIAGAPFQVVRNASASTTAFPLLMREETARTVRDPDFKWLVANIASNDALRKQTSLSLNLKTRQEERTRLDRERLARENERRAAHNLPAINTVEEIDVKTAPDILLDQSAQIVADMIAGPAKSTDPVLAKDQKLPARRTAESVQ